MKTEVTNLQENLSPWWRRSALTIGLACFAVLVWLTAKTYADAPPIPERVIGPDRQVLFTDNDILAGQQVFLKYGLMDNGTVWGHGGYLGPDFSAQYLHNLALDAGKFLLAQRFKHPQADLADVERSAVEGEIRFLLKQNRYDRESRTLAFTEPEAISFRRQIGQWAAYFQNPAGNGGLPTQYISDPEELRQLSTFFAWTAWASAANRPGKDYSYTNNFPYEPLAGNTPTADAVLWSALSLIFLLGGIALVLFAFGKFDYLGWKSTGAHRHPHMLPGDPTDSQRATVKFFVVRAVVFGPNPGGRGDGTLSRRSRQLLRHRPGRLPAQPDSAHLASATGDILDRHRICCRRSIPGACVGAGRAARPEQGRPSAVRSPCRGSRRQLVGRVAGRESTAQTTLVLVRSSRLGVPGIGTRLWEWLRLPGDLVFILFGAVPLTIAASLAYRALRQSEPSR
jgi:nitric oxide reductase large subunit